MPSKTIKITSSYGHLLVNRQTGAVAECHIRATDDYSKELANAFWFDLEEYYVFRDDLDRNEITHIDVCAILYHFTKPNGTVGIEEPAYDWREDLKTDFEGSGYITDFIDYLVSRGVDDHCVMTFSEDNSVDNRYALTFSTEEPGLAYDVALYFGCPARAMETDCTQFENSDFWSGKGNFRHLADALTKSQGQFFDVELTLGELKELVKYGAEDAEVERLKDEKRGLYPDKTDIAN